MVLAVSIHARVERATTDTVNEITDASFNPRTRRACDSIQGDVHDSTPVSIHARVERATFSSLVVCIQSACFNPRTRRACDKKDDLAERMLKVSIHARVERAT